MFPRIRELIKTYATDGVSDRNAVQNYMDCENEDTIRSLRNELTGIASGTVLDEPLNPVLGIKRKATHGSNADWAKRMLLWMAEYRR